MLNQEITPTEKRVPDTSLRAKIYAKISTLLSSYSSASLANLEKLYIFRDPNDVKSFLRKNRFLIPLLQEAHTHIARYFPDPEVCLQVVHDPEIIDLTQLVAFIITEQSAEEASNTLDHFDDDWGLNAIERITDKLCITLEFK